MLGIGKLVIFWVSDVIMLVIDMVEFWWDLLSVNICLLLI